MSVDHEATEFFYSLTPDRVLDAVEEIGVECTGRALALNSMENRVYQLEIELPAGVEEKSRYDRYRVAKFYRPGRWSREQILEEHEFLFDLEAKEIPVGTPLKFPDGKSLKVLKDAEIYYAVFPRIGGRTLDELTQPQIERIGRTLARVHMIGAAKEARHRKHLTSQTYALDSLEQLLSLDVIPATCVDRYRSVVESIASLTTEWAKDVPMQRIHGDLHAGNIIWDDDACMLVDFDDMVIGPCVQDLWLLTPGRDEYALTQREKLLEAYQELRHFNPDTLRLIEPLRALRMVHFSAWIANRWSDPIFPRTFENFGTEEYWFDQLRALDEVLQIMHGRPPSDF